MFAGRHVSMYDCMHAYMFYTCGYIYVYRHTNMYLYTHVYMSIAKHKWGNTYVFGCMHVCMQILRQTCMSLYVCFMHHMTLMTLAMAPFSLSAWDDWDEVQHEFFAPVMLLMHLLVQHNWNEI